MQQKELPPMFRHRFLAHALGGYAGLAYLNNETCLLNSIKNGFRYLEVDLKLADDGELVCSHGWSRKNCEAIDMPYKDSFSYMTRELFLQQEIHGMKTMDAALLYEYLKDNPDLFLELDLHSLSYEKAVLVTKKVLELFHHDDELLKRCLVQSNSYDMWEGINSVYQFCYQQFIVLNEIERLDEYIRFCTEHQICAMALKKKYADPQNMKKIKEAGLALLIFTVNDLQEARVYWESGADTVCTDFLTPEQVYTRTSFQLVYNSTPNAKQRFGKLIERNILRGKLRETAKGSWEYCEKVIFQPDGNCPLIACCYEKEGYKFLGWHMRYRNGQKEWLWYCKDGSWRTKSQLTHIGGDIRYLFCDMEIIDMDLLPVVNKVIMEAVWTAER